MSAAATDCYYKIMLCAYKLFVCVYKNAILQFNNYTVHEDRSADDNNMKDFPCPPLLSSAHKRIVSAPSSTRRDRKNNAIFIRGCVTHLITLMWNSAHKTKVVFSLTADPRK